MWSESETDGWANLSGWVYFSIEKLEKNEGDNLFKVEIDAYVQIPKLTIWRQ